MGQDKEGKLTLTENELLDKKSFQSTMNPSLMGSAKSVEFNFVKISPERKKATILSSISLLPIDNRMDRLFNNTDTKCEYLIKRRDKFNNPIMKGKKDHKVTFKDEFIEKVFIESYKEINKQIDIKTTNTCSNCACNIF